MENKMEMSKVINYFSYKYKGDWDDIYGAIQQKEKIDMGDLDDFLNSNDKKISYISIIDTNYPNNFKEIYMPPLTIYYYGNKEILFNDSDIVSLWGEITNDNINNLNNYKAVALEFNEANLKIVESLLNKGLKVILVDFSSFKIDFIDKISDWKNVVYISEIPNVDNANIKVTQNCERLLLGIANKSIFFNDNDELFNKYKKISTFEKRKMNVAGRYKQKYLAYASQFKN